MPNIQLNNARNALYNGRLRRFHFHRVDFLNKIDDFQVALMGQFGFSNKAIQKKVNYSNSQITYRLRKAKIRRFEYRNGENELSQLIIAGTARTAAKQLRQEASRKLLLYFQQKQV